MVPRLNELPVTTAAGKLRFRRQDSRPPPGAPARQVPFQPIHALAERRFATVCSDLAGQLCVDAARSHGGRNQRTPMNCSETLEKSRLRINQRVMTNCTDLTKHGAVCAKALQSLWQVFVEHLPTRPLEAPLLQEREQRKTQAQQVVKQRC